MACIIKVGNKFENLSGYNTYITDKDPNSQYFRVNKFADTFTAGKNLFLMEGSECLKESTELRIEIVDADGDTLYVEPGRGVPDYYEGNSIVLSSHVYEKTPVGPAKITILGELRDYFDEDGIKRPIPSDWEGAYNVKWEKEFYINKNESNKTPVIFYKRPEITIEEVESTIVEQTFSTITQTGQVIGRAENPPRGTDLNTWRAGTLYRLEKSGGAGFKSSMDENIISIPSLEYEGRVKEVISSNALLVDRPFIDSDNKVIDNLADLDYSISFTDFGDRTSNNSAVTASFGRIKLSRLDTFTGNVDKLKVFKKSRSDVGDYKFSDEIKIVAGNLLRDPLIPGSDLDGGFGRLTESNVETYWQTSSIQISGSDSTISADDDDLFESIKINVPSSSLATDTVDLVTNTIFDIYDDVDYELNFRTLVSGAFEDVIPGEVTVVSQSYARTYYYKYDPSKLTLFEPTYVSESSYTELDAPNSQSVDLTKPLVYDNSRVSFYNTPQNLTGSVYTSIPSGYAYTHSHDTTLTFDTTSGDWGTNSRVQSDSDNKTNIVATSGSFCGNFNLVVWLDSGSYELPTGGSPTDVRTYIETFDSASVRIAVLSFENIDTDAKFYYKHSATTLDELDSFRTSTEYSLENIDTNDYNDSSVVSTFNTGSQTIINYNDGGHHYVHIDYRTLRNIEPLNADLVTVKRLDSLNGDILYGTSYDINSINFETGDIEFSHNSTDSTISGVLALENGQAVLTIGSDTDTGYIVELDFQRGIMVFVGEIDFTELVPAQRSYDLYDLFDLSGSNWISTGSTELFVPRVPPRGGDYLYSDNGYPYSSTTFSDRNFLTTEFTSPSSSDDNFTKPLEIPYIFRNDDDIIENVYVEDSDQIYVVSSVSSSSDIDNTNYIYDQDVVFTGWFYTGSLSGSIYVDESQDSNTNNVSLPTYNSLITSHTPISSSIGEFNIVLLTDSGSSAIPTNTGSVEFQVEYYQSASQELRAAIALRNVETDAMFFYNNSATSQSVLESYSGSTNIILDSIDSGDFNNTELWFLSTGSQAIFDLESGSNSHFIYIDYRTNRNSEPLNADLNEITAISQVGTNNFLPLKAREVFPLSGSTDITGSVTSTDYYTSQLPLVAGNHLYTLSDYPFVPAPASDGTYVTDDVDPTTDVTIPDTLFEIPYVFDTVDGKIENVYVKEFDDIYTASSDNGTGITTFTDPPVFVSQSLKAADTIIPKTISAFITGSYPSGGLDYPFNEPLVTFTANSEFNSRQQIQHLFTMPYSGSGKLGFAFRGDGWQVSKVDFKPSQDAAFSPKVFDVFDEQNRTLPVETFDYKFELYDVNNNYVPVELFASKEFSGGNKVSDEVIKLLTFESDRTAFRFYSGSLANPSFQQIKFNFSKTNALSGSITFESSAYDRDGNYIDPSSYTGDYPGGLTSVTSNNALLTIASFSGSDSSYEVSSIVYTSSVDNVEEYETIFRLEDGQPVADLIVNNDRTVMTFNQANGIEDPTEQISTITVKRKNLESTTEVITANSASVVGSAPPLTLLSDNTTTGIATYFVSGSSLNLQSGSLTYSFTSSDEFGVQVDNSTTVTPISFLGGVVLYLSNERGVLPAFASGIIPSASFSYTSGSTKLYVNGDQIDYNNSGGNNTYKITGVTGSGITPNEVAPTTNNYGGIPGTMPEESSSLEINIQYTDSSGEFYDFGREANFNIVREGEQGQPGLEGSNGPGLVFTGQWTGSRDYTRTTGSLARADAALQNNEFYLAISSSGPSSAEGAISPADDTSSLYWEALGTASRFVAAELAIFAESYVQNNINVGTNNSGSASAANITIAGGTNYPYISIDQGATTGTQGYNVGNGIFLGINGNTGTGSFSIESGLTNNELTWDGDTLNIRGNITVTNTEDYITPTDTGSMLDGYTQDANTSSLQNPSEYSFGSVFSLASASAVTGLNLTADYLGYYDGSAFDSYMDSSGNFYLGGDSGALQWDGSNLVISGAISITNTSDFAPTNAEANDSSQDNPSNYDFGPDASFDLSTVGTPTTNGLYLGSDKLGFYNSGWKTYMDNSGNFYLGGTSGALTWDGSSLAIEGDITVTNTSDFAPTDAEANDSNQDNPSSYSFGGSGFTLATNTANTGLNLTSEYLGYHDGTDFQTYMDNSGNFYLGGTGGKLTWNGSVLDIEGKVKATSGEFTGTVTAGQGQISNFVIDADSLETTDGSFLLNTSESGSIIFQEGGNLKIKISNTGELTPNTTFTTPTVQQQTWVGQGSSTETANSAYAYVSFYDGTTEMSSAQYSSLPEISTTSDVNNFPATFTATVQTPTGGKYIDSTTSGWSGTPSSHNLQVYLVVRLYEGTSNSLGSQIGEKTIFAEAYSNTNSASTNGVMGSNPVSFSTTINGGSYYRILTGTKNRQGAAYGGTLSSTGYLNSTFYNPGISDFSVSVTDPGSNPFTEITQGGFQVVTSNTKAVLVNTDTTGDALSITGSLSATGNITAFSTSDERLKENIIPIPLALDKVNELNGVTFDWKGGYEDVHQFKGEDIGVIAQEVEKVIPHITNINKQNGYYGVRYEKITPLLIEAIKELSQKVNDLENEIKRLK